jgi:hypothetical protein
LLNRNNLLRIGWGPNKGSLVFRVGIGGFRPGIGNTIRNALGPYWSHIDF